MYRILLLCPTFMKAFLHFEFKTPMIVVFGGNWLKLEFGFSLLTIFLLFRKRKSFIIYGQNLKILATVKRMCKI